jgi:hypothetical protein
MGMTRVLPGQALGATTGPRQQSPVRSLLQAAGIAPIGDEVQHDDDLYGGLHGLPLIQLLDRRSFGPHYCAATTMNDRGRLADRTLLKAMSWSASTAITISAVEDAGIIVVTRGGMQRINRHGHLQLPAAVRHGCRILGGERLLAVARPHHHVIVIYTPYALDAMATAYHDALTAGAGS